MPAVFFVLELHFIIGDWPGKYSLYYFLLLKSIGGHVRVSRYWEMSGLCLGSSCKTKNNLCFVCSFFGG